MGGVKDLRSYVNISSLRPSLRPRFSRDSGLTLPAVTLGEDESGKPRQSQSRSIAPSLDSERAATNLVRTAGSSNGELHATGNSRQLEGMMVGPASVKNRCPGTGGEDGGSQDVRCIHEMPVS